MRCMQGFAVVGALAIVGVTLSGCGGSGKKREFHFVSQSFEDNSGVEYLGNKFEDLSYFTTPQYSVNLDMEEGKVRIDMKITTKINGEPGSSASVHETSGIVFDIPSRKIYVSSSSEGKTQIKGQPPTETLAKQCGFVVLTVGQADFKTCLAEKEKNLKMDVIGGSLGTVTVATRTKKLPNAEDSKKMDDYTDTIEWNVDDRNMVYAVQATTHRMSHKWEKGKDTVLTTRMKFADDYQRKAGTPPAEVFMIPEEWGECHAEWTKDRKEWSIVEKAYHFVPTPIWTCMGMEVPSNDESDLEVVAMNVMTNQATDEGAATQFVV